MSQWSSAKAKRVLAALLRIGWTIKRESSSHKILSRPGYQDVVFAFHDKDEGFLLSCVGEPLKRNVRPYSSRYEDRIFC